MRRLLLNISGALFLTIGLAILANSTSQIAPASKATLSLPSLPFQKAPREGALKDPTISFLFTGDIMLDRYIATLRAKNGGTFPFTHMPEIIETVQQGLEADSLNYIVGNVEGPISDSKYKNPGTAMRFNFKPETAQQLADVGFNVANLANNHTLDQGQDYFKQTHEYLTAAGILAFGHQDTAKGEWTFKTDTIQGKTIGFVGFNDAVTRLDREAALQKIKEVDPLVDFLVVAVHWGIEYEKTARTSVVELAHQMVDSGADFIWGTHPHVVQNSEVYNGVPIYYSLGNFVFDQYWSAETQKGLVVGMTWDGTQVKTVEVPVELVNKGEPKAALPQNPHSW